jgi:hypothetical protein
MDNNLTTVLSANTGQPANAAANAAGVTGVSSTGNKPTLPNNTLLEEMVKRLSKQGEGVSTSASSELQTAIQNSITATEQAGALTAQRLESERGREVGFLRDRGQAQFTGALEERRGYATQVAALRELTETTEKSVRDLDARYNEALMANDANTIAEVSKLRISALEYKQKQEQDFFSNVMSVANLQQSAIDSVMRREEFWSGQEQQERQFVMSLANSKYEFEQNMSMQYKELGLKEQELDIARERNSISRAEYNLRKSEIQGEKNTTFVKAAIRDRIQKMQDNGMDVSGMDILSFTTQFGAELGTTIPGFKMEADTLAQIVNEAKTDVMSNAPSTVQQSTGRVGGVLPALGSAANELYGFGDNGLMRNFTNFWFGARQ